MIPLSPLSRTAWFADALEEAITIDENLARRKLKIETFYNEQDKILKLMGIDYTFKEIIFANFEIIKTIAISIKNQTINYDNQKFKKLTKLYGKLVANNTNIQLIEKLGIRVCPYCNSNYINNRKTSATAQLDHFYNQSKYAIFAVSISNLIPSCYACNHIKKEQEIPVSPYNEAYNFENSLIFTFTPHSIDFISNCAELSIEIRTISDATESCDEKADIGENIRKLQIDKAYEIQNEYIHELINKAIIYNELQIQELVDLSSDVNWSSEDVHRLIFGYYFDKDNFNKRPLSKLTHDVFNELDVHI